MFNFNKLLPVKGSSLYCGALAVTLALPVKSFSAEFVYDSDPKKATVKKLFYEGFSGGNLAVIDEIIAPDFVLDDPNLPPGREGLKAIVKKNNRTFADWAFVIHDMLIDGDKVTVRWTGSGRHVGSFMGEQPTNETVHLQGISIYLVRDGKIQADWVIPDNLGFLKQLGVIELKGLVE